MNRSVTRMVTAVAAAGLFSFVLVPAASADSFLAVFQGTAPNGANTDFQYNLQFNTGSSTERLEAGDFVTIYDINQFVSATAPALFHLTTQALGINGPGTAPTDSATLINVTFVYDGPPTPVLVDSTFPGAVITSKISSAGAGVFTGQDTLISDGSKLGNFGRTIVPVPLPAAAWMGMALLGGTGFSGFLRRRKLNNAEA